MLNPIIQLSTVSKTNIGIGLGGADKGSLRLFFCAFHLATLGLSPNHTSYDKTFIVKFLPYLSLHSEIERK